MSTYVIAHVRSTDFGPAIVEYLQKVDATLEPFGGRVVVHGDHGVPDGYRCADVLAKA